MTLRNAVRTAFISFQRLSSLARSVRPYKSRIAQFKTPLYVTMALSWPFAFKEAEEKAASGNAAVDDLELNKSKQREEAQSALIKALQFAKLKTMQQQFPQAMRHYHDALRELLILHNLHNDDLLSESEYQRAKVKIYLEMANTQMVAGELKDAESLFLESLRGLPQVGEDVESNAFLEVSLKLAEIYAFTERYSEARNGFEYCSSILREKCERPLSVNAATNSAANNSGVSKGKPEAENEGSNSSVRTTEHDRDAHIAGYSCDANTLALLGMTLDAFGRFLYLRADYNEQKRRSDSASSTQSETEKVSTHKDFADSLNLFEKAHTIASAVYGTGSSQALRLRNELACVYTSLNDNETAQKVLETTIHECEASKDPAGRENLPAFQLNLATVYLQQFVVQRKAQAAKPNLEQQPDSKQENLSGNVEELNNLLKQAAKLCKSVRSIEDEHMKKRADECLKRINELHRSLTAPSK